MSSGSYVKESILAFYYSHFFVPAVAALVFVAIFYATQSKDNSTIPLYLPEKSAAGNYKTRWVWDSVNLLQEAYRKVEDETNSMLTILADLSPVQRQAVQGMDDRGSSGCHTPRLCG